jgi:hypothetical protein
VANILKEKYPNDLMKIKEDTILPYSKEHSRKIKRKGMGSYYALYTNSSPPRVIIKQKILSERICLRTKVQNQKDRIMLYGNFALVELMCHELAHHRTTRHAKSFKIKYKKFLSYMVSVIFSGDFDEK